MERVVLVLAPTAVATGARGPVLVPADAAVGGVATTVVLGQVVAAHGVAGVRAQDAPTSLGAAPRPLRIAEQATVPVP